MSSDGIRERQLADLGWHHATVNNDGHNVVVTMSVADWDELMASCDVDAYDLGYQRGLGDRVLS